MENSKNTQRHNNTSEEEKRPDISNSQAPDDSTTSRGQQETRSETMSLVDRVAEEAKVRHIDTRGPIS